MRFGTPDPITKSPYLAYYTDIAPCNAARQHWEVAFSGVPVAESLFHKNFFYNAIPSNASNNWFRRVSLHNALDAFPDSLVDQDVRYNLEGKNTNAQCGTNLFQFFCL